MRIITNTPDVLAVVHDPWIMRWAAWLGGAAAFVFGGIFADAGPTLFERVFVAALGAGFMWFGWHFCPRQSAVLHRPSQTLTLREDRITGSASSVHALADIDDVVATEGAGDYNGLHSLLFVINGVRTPLEKGYVAQERKTIRDAIRAWLTQARKAQTV
ncbi:MAG: hypothetical protein AAGI06_17730 [Pseudomonadota bacterium]